MSGTHADPAVLDALSSTLRNASTDLEAGAVEPPQPELGVVTGAVTGALAMLTNALGNVVTGVGDTGDAVAEGRDLYVETDYEQAAALRAGELNADQPR